jgi:tRNA dimethylallyltransferase
LENKKYLISIVGPTAVGKTALAIQLAKHYKTVILSADSRQFYKEITIGTAKPNMQELAEVKHYFINNKSVVENYSAGDFEREAMELLKSLYKNNQIVILVGGSGLYIKALWEGLDEMPPIDEKLRNELISNFEEKGIIYLQEKLSLLDVNRMENMDSKNPQRLMRAIEIASLNTLFTKTKIPRPFDIIKICLNKERELLYQNINIRVDIMIKNGLLNECEQMIDYKNHYALKTVGYTEMFQYFDGIHSLPKAVDLVKQHSRNYAKRQITWFKRETDLQWFEPNETIKIIPFINNKME